MIHNLGCEEDFAELTNCFHIITVKLNYRFKIKVFVIYNNVHDF